MCCFKYLMSFIKREERLKLIPKISNDSFYDIILKEEEAYRYPPSTKNIIRISKGRDKE